MNLWKPCLGTLLLILGVHAGQTQSEAPAKTQAKPDSMVVAMKAAAESSSKALSTRVEAETATKKKVLKDSEKIRKYDGDRAKFRVEKLKQEIAAESKARKAQKGYMEPKATALSKESSPSEKK